MLEICRLPTSLVLGVHLFYNAQIQYVHVAPDNQQRAERAKKQQEIALALRNAFGLAEAATSEETEWLDAVIRFYLNVLLLLELGGPSSCCS